jgi:hypothetical protein
MAERIGGRQQRRAIVKQKLFLCNRSVTLHENSPQYTALKESNTDAVRALFIIYQSVDFLVITDAFSTNLKLTESSCDKYFLIQAYRVVGKYCYYIAKENNGWEINQSQVNS